MTDHERLTEPDANPPACRVCGVPWRDHLGCEGLCRKLQDAAEELVQLRAENAQLTKLLAEWVQQADAGMFDGVDLGLMVSSEELLEVLKAEEAAGAGGES